MGKHEFVRHVCRGVLSAVACVAMATGAQAETVDVTQANVEQNRKLQNGNTYRFIENVEYTAQKGGGSALQVASDATVTLEIPAGVTVTLRGGDAPSMTGAGAGIEVPAKAKLYIIGEGTLNVTGGNAADGLRGADGESGKLDSANPKVMTSGLGGGGGAGGGGAGAGIGGKGGKGGNGGQGAQNSAHGVGERGQPGKKGATGGAGGTCGDVMIGGSVTVLATGGKAGAAGAGGRIGRNAIRDEVKDGESDRLVVSGGGGGGSGAGGAAAQDIGGGGGGGFGGGGGGSGGINYKSSIPPGQDYRALAQGRGGYGGKNGQPSPEPDSVWNRFRGGRAGAGGSHGAAGARGGSGSLTITGGCVKAVEVGKIPKNGAGEDFHCVNVECAELGEQGSELGIAGLNGYWMKGSVPIGGRVCLWLPNGTHRFTLSDGTTTLCYYAVVKGRDISVEPLGPVGFFVNGEDIGNENEEGEGWRYDYVKGVLSLTNANDYVLSGLATNGTVQINVTGAGARVILSNAVVFTEGHPALVVEENASLLMAGDTSCLAATNGAEAVAVTVAAGKTLTVDLGPGGNRLESMICAFAFDAANVISGGGTVQVIGGTIFAWSDVRAFAEGTVIKCGEGVMMKTGDDPETATFASTAAEAPCVLVAPVVTVTVAKGIPHVSGVTVSNAVEEITGEKIEDVMVYRVMLEDDVFVDYAVEEGYASQVENPLVYREVEDENIAIDEKTIPVAQVPVAVTVLVTVGEGVEKVICDEQEYEEDFLLLDVEPGTALTFTMVMAGDQYDEDVSAEGDVTGGKFGTNYVYTVASELSGQNAAIRFNTTVAPAVAYAYEDSKIIFLARCSTFAEAWAYARSDGKHYVKIFKDYTGSESSEQFALDGTMRVNFNGHTVYATAERGKGFAIETVNSRHRTYTPYDTIAEAYAMGGSQTTYVVLGTADASTITLRPGNLGFEGHFWEGDGGIVGSIVNEPKLKNAEKTEKWSVSDTNFEFVAWTDKPTPLMPGQGSKPYETWKEAEEAAAVTEVLPAEEFDLLGHPDALDRWQGYFVNQIYFGGDGKFRIMPELNEAGSNALAQTEAKLTRAINVNAIAAATGAIEEIVLTGAEPGFYYTLFRSADVTTVLEQESHDPDNCDCKALSDGTVTFTNVTKPSAAAGFFSVRAFVKESFTSNPFGGGGFGGFGE